MAVTLTLMKTQSGALVPVTSEDREKVDKIKVGSTIRGEWKKQRNVQFFRKWWALVDFAFEHWEPGEIDDPRFAGMQLGKDKERFRKDLIILTGRYDVTHRLDGSFRVEAKSIAFGAMTEEEFNQLYSDTIDVVLQKVLKNYTREDLERVIMQLMAFT